MSGIDPGWALAAFFLSIRIGAVALLAPPLAGGMIPASVRVAIVLSWAAVFAASMNATLGTNTGLQWPPSLGNLLVAAANEAMLGSVMALGLNMAFAMFSLGARLLDVQIGFGIGQVFDPLTRQQSPVLGVLYSQLAGVCFFLLDIHHAMLRGLALSIDAIPPGAHWPPEALLQAITRQAGQMFSLGFAMVAPIVFCLMLAELGLGVLSRNLPQMNTLVVGVPVKIVVGVAALGFWVSTATHPMQKAYDSTFVAWSALWR